VECPQSEEAADITAQEVGISSNVTKVLYIEHDDDNLYMLKTRLERVGDFQVLAAQDSEKGCKLAVTERPDVILMDLEMPVLDRWETESVTQSRPFPALGEQRW
jgi:CheY-like chemotaxis protein